MCGLCLCIPPGWFDLNVYVEGPVASSAFHLLTVIDFLSLAAGTYLLLILHERRRRLGYVVTAIGLGVLALQIVPEHVAMPAESLRFAGGTLTLLIAGLLIVWGTLSLLGDEPRRRRLSPSARVFLAVAAAFALIGTLAVWSIPFWGPVQQVLRTAASGNAFMTFQHGLRVAVAAALIACTWFTWERQTLGRETSRMFGAAYICWAAGIGLGVLGLWSPERALWITTSIRVLGSLFIGNALILYVYHAERVALERQRRLALIDSVASAVLAAPRLVGMVQAAADEVRELLAASTAAIYLLADARANDLLLTYSSGREVNLPSVADVSDGHPVAQSLASGGPATFKVSVALPDGGASEAEAVAVPLAGVHRAIGVLVVVMPPREKLSQDELVGLCNTGAQVGIIIQHMMGLEDTREARDRWSQTFDSITELITVHDRDGTTLAANRAARDFTGVDEHGAVGKRLCDIFSDDCEEQEQMLSSCLSSGTAPGTGMHEVRGRTFQVAVTPLRDDRGEVTGCVRVARDMTSRRRAEERLAQSERRYRDLAESANDIIYTHDLAGNFLYVNAAAVRALGYSQEEFSRLRFWDVVAPESLTRARKYIDGLVSGQPQDDQVELRITCSDGRVAVLQLRASVVRRSGQGDTIHVIARDVTAEKQLAAQLIQADRLASVGTLIAGIAHELNNPLTAISGYADLLAADHRYDADRVAIATIAEEAERCRKVAQNLLNFARHTDDRMIEFDFNALIGGVFDLRAYDLRAARIEVITRLAEGMPRVLGDYSKLQQVMYNLIDNAYYALDGRGGGSLEISTWSEDGRVYARVSDSGPGIPESLLDRVFEPFVTTKPRGEGTGLGLSICKRILDEHGGTIKAGNSGETGAAFTISLPVAPVGTREAPEPSETEPLEAPTVGDRLHVLFIDDEPSLLALVGEYLRRMGHQVTVAGTGEEGLELALQGDYDMIICDMRLPGISGEDVCMRLLEDKPEAAERIVVATGDVLSPQTQDFFERTGMPHIHKPFKLEALNRTIANRIAGRPVGEH